MTALTCLCVVKASQQRAMTPSIHALTSVWCTNKKRAERRYYTII